MKEYNKQRLLIIGLLLVIIGCNLLAVKILDKDCPDCKCENEIEIPVCPDCNCPSIPDCVCNTSHSVGFQGNVSVSLPLSDSSLVDSPETLIFDSKCKGEPFTTVMYSVERGLCRRDEFGSVRSGYNPERCCLTVGGMTFVDCMTLGNATLIDSNNEWVALNCYK